MLLFDCLLLICSLARSLSLPSRSKKIYWVELKVERKKKEKGRVCLRMSTSGLIPTVEVPEAEAPISLGSAAARDASAPLPASEKVMAESEGSESDEEDSIAVFTSDDEALAARQVGLRLYNDGKYYEALDIQCAVVQHFTSKLGQTHAGCGLYYLDYGLSLLRSIQCRESSAAAVQPVDDDGLETTFINLDTARICFEKAEAKDPENEEVQLRLAEVHNAIAQVYSEQENFDKALMEYESELAIYRSLDVPHPGKIVAAQFGIADCYLKECDFDEGEVRLAACLEEVAKYPPGTFAEELVTELGELLAEATEMKGGKYKEVQEAVRAQFSDQAEAVPTAEEFAASQSSAKNPLVSELPACDVMSMSHQSIPLALSGVPLRENSNSLSVSLFQPIGAFGSKNNSNQGAPVNIVVARKKPKQTSMVTSALSTETNYGLSDCAAEMTTAGAVEEPSLKKARLEEPSS